MTAPVMAIERRSGTGVAFGAMPGKHVTYLDLDSDGVPDAVRTTEVTYLGEQVAGPNVRVVETVEAVDDDGSVRLLQFTERYEYGRSGAIA